MMIGLCIIAKDEAGAIGNLIAQLSRQRLWERVDRFQLVVVANGCSDATAEVARTSFEACFDRRADICLLVHETLEGGKARSWNLAVHQLFDAEVDVAIFADADIELAGDHVLDELLDTLLGSPEARAVSGHPVKDIAKKRRKTPLDRFSLRVSGQTPARHTLNGSLYVAHMAELKKIWLPVPTPVEDGMLSAMILTDGFSSPPKPRLIENVDHTTHYFEAHSICGFFRHETRLTVGTTINGWICEYFWASHRDGHIGPIVRNWNEEDPQWIDRLVHRHTVGKRWVLPPRMLTWRLHNLRGAGLMRALAHAPFSIAATLLNFGPSVRANGLLKRQGSAGYW